MSVIIKSNNEASNGFGTIAMMNNTPELVYDQYAARVSAEGGVIRDEQRTRAAIELLFNAKVYGMAETVVSGSFGVKLNPEGQLTKLFAIDGQDLVGVVFGSGSLPLLSDTNEVLFNSSGSDGSIMTTEEPSVLSKSGQFALLTRMGDFSSAPLRTPFAALTQHSDEVNAAPFFTVVRGGTQVIDFQVQGTPLNKTTPNYAVHIRISLSASPDSLIGVLNVPAEDTRYGYRKGVSMTSSPVRMFDEIMEEKLYIDWGGAWKSDSKTATAFAARDLFVFGDTSKNAMELMSNFK